MTEKKESTTGRQIRLPSVATFFPIKRNPLQDDYRVQEMIEQVFEYSLLSFDDYNKVKEVTIFTAHFHPFCSDIKKYVNLARMMQMFFVVDDHTECKWGDVARSSIDSNMFWGQFDECLDKILDKNKSFFSMANWKPYMVMQYIVLEEMYQDYQDDQMRRLCETLREYSQANTIECLLIEKNHRLKSWDEFSKVRIGSSGVKAVFQMIEYADDIHLTDKEWYDPLMQQYVEHGTILVMLDNDIVSYEKENLESKFLKNEGKTDVLINIVAFTKAHDNCSVDEAMAKSGQLYQDFSVKMKEIKRQILERGDTSEGVRKFVDRAEYVVGGNFAGGRILKRYKNE